MDHRNKFPTIFWADTAAPPSDRGMHADTDTLHRAQAEGPFRTTRIVEGLMRLGQNGIHRVIDVQLHEKH